MSNDPYEHHGGWGGGSVNSQDQRSESSRSSYSSGSDDPDHDPYQSHGNVYHQPSAIPRASSSDEGSRTPPVHSPSHSSRSSPTPHSHPYNYVREHQHHEYDERSASYYSDSGSRTESRTRSRSRSPSHSRSSAHSQERYGDDPDNTLKRRITRVDYTHDHDDTESRASSSRSYGGEGAKGAWRTMDLTQPQSSTRTSFKGSPLASPYTRSTRSTTSRNSGRSRYPHYNRVKYVQTPHGESLMETVSLNSRPRYEETSEDSTVLRRVTATDRRVSLLGDSPVAEETSLVPSGRKSGFSDFSARSDGSRSLKSVYPSQRWEMTEAERVAVDLDDNHTVYTYLDEDTNRTYNKVVKAPERKIVKTRIVKIPVEKIVERERKVPVPTAQTRIVKVPVKTPEREVKVVKVPRKIVREVPIEVEKIVEVEKRVPYEVVKEKEVVREVEVPVEVPVVREVEVKVPYEVVKEVPVDRVREVEVTKKVEVIKEVEVVKEVPGPVREVEKIVHVPVEKIVEVEKVVEKFVEVPVAPKSKPKPKQLLYVHNNRDPNKVREIESEVREQLRREGKNPNVHLEFVEHIADSKTVRPPQHTHLVKVNDPRQPQTAVRRAPPPPPSHAQTQPRPTPTGPPTPARPPPTGIHVQGSPGPSGVRPVDQY